MSLALLSMGCWLYGVFTIMDAKERGEALIGLVLCLVSAIGMLVAW